MAETVWAVSKEQYDRLQDKVDRLMRLLESLTPGGSEFHESPERCAEFARNGFTLARTQASLRKKAEAERDDARTWAHRWKAAAKMHRGFCTHFQQEGQRWQGRALTAGREVERLREALQWIADNDQTERPNGGDPVWFAEQAPIRARKALGM